MRVLPALQLVACLIVVFATSSSEAAPAKGKAGVKPARSRDARLNKLWKMDNRRTDLHENKVLAAACSADIKKYCPNVPLGEQRVRRCMQDHKYEPGIDKRCQQEIIFDEISQAASYDNIRIEKCEMTASELCSAELQAVGLDADDAASRKAKDAIVRCLIANLDKIGTVAEGNGESECEDEVFRDVREQSEDIRLAPDVNVACEADMTQFCSGVKPGRGRVHKCLKMHLTELSHSCLNAEFTETMQESKDIRLKASVYEACKGVDVQLCRGIRDASERIECLQDHISDPVMTEDCRKELEDDLVIESQSVIFQPSLHRKCKVYLDTTCNDDEMSRKDPETGLLVYGSDNPALYCLIAHAPEIKDRACRNEVKRVERQQASSVKFDLRTARHCRQDIAKFCEDVVDSEGKLHACLQSHLDDLSSACRRSEFADIKMVAADASVNVRLQTVCKSELRSLCGGDDPDADHGDGVDADRDFVCLTSHLDDSAMGRPCKNYLMNFKKLTRGDVNMRPRVVRTCSKDMGRLCTDAGLDVVTCLVDNVEDIHSPDCKELIQEEIELESRDVDLDPKTRSACLEDLQTYCSDLKRDGSYGTDGEAQQCLQKNFERLTKPCQNMQRRVIARSSQSIRFKPTMRRACQSEMKSLCSLFNPTSAEMLLCLRDHRDDTSMGTHCREELVADEAAINADIRSDEIFMAQCRTTLRRLCSDVLNADKTPADQATHAIEKCLLDNEDKMRAQSRGGRSCREALETKLKGQASDIRLDPTVNKACAEDEKKLCSNISPGAGRVHECLREHFGTLSPDCQRAEFEAEVVAAGDILQQPRIREACAQDIVTVCGPDQSSSPGDDVLECLKTLAVDRKSELSIDCRSTVMKELKLESKNVRLNARLFKSCEQSFSVTCPKIAGIVEIEAGALSNSESEELIDCMMNNRNAVKDPQCKDALTHEMIRRATDFELDPGIHRDCAMDVHFYCSDVAVEAVHACLRDNLDGLNPQCKKREQQEQVRESMDIRLKPTLLSTCRAEVRKYCASVSDEESPGSLLMCLEDHMKAQQFSSSCRSLVYSEQKQQVSKLKFNAPLLSACDTALRRMCHDYLEDDAAATQCLIDHRDEPTIGAKCRSIIVRQAQAQANDINLNPEVNSACYFDQREFCEGIASGEGRIYECLEKHIDELSPACRDAEFKVLKLKQEDIQFNPQMLKSCEKEKIQFCSREQRQWRNTNDGEALIACLEKNRRKPNFGAACTKAVQANLKLASQDIELRPSLARTCQKDIQRLCVASSSRSENRPRHRGAAIQCLLDHLDDIEEPACKASAMDQAEEQAKDINIAAAELADCMDDILRVCSDFVVDNGAKERTLKAGVRLCLTDHRELLSDKCTAAQFKEAERESKHARLADEGQLFEACSSELKRECSSGGADDGTALSCLVLKSDEPEVEFSEECSSAVAAYQSLTLTDLRLVPQFWEHCAPLVATMCTKELAASPKLTKIADRSGDNVRLVAGNLLASKNVKPTGFMTKDDANAVFQCLMTRRNKVRSSSARCAAAVMFVGTQFTQAMRVYDKFGETCKEDIDSLCGNMDESDANGIVRCLQSNMKKVSKKCKKLVNKWKDIGSNAAKQVAKNAKQIKQEERQAIVNAGGKQALKIADIILRDERNKKRTSGSDEVFQLSGWVALASMLSLAAVLVVIIYIGTKAIIRRTGCCARSEANRKNVTYNTV